MFDDVDRFNYAAWTLIGFYSSQYTLSAVCVCVCVCVFHWTVQLWQ